MDRPIFAKRLIERRNLKKLTQQEVADRTGLSRARLNNYEQGIRQPDIDTMIRLAIFFQVTTDYLLGKTDNPLFLTIDTVREQTSSYIVNEEVKCTPLLPQFSDDELALIEKYRRMKDHEKDTMHKVAETIAPNDDQSATFAKGC